MRWVLISINVYGAITFLMDVFLLFRKQEVEQQEKDLAGLPEECIKPIILEIIFDANSNKIAKKDDSQLIKIAQFLIEN